MRKSRFSHKQNPDLPPKIIGEPTLVDIKVLELLHRYQFLPSHYIKAMIDAPESTVELSLKALSTEPNNYIYALREIQYAFRSLNRHLVYHIDKKGQKHLGLKPKPVSTTQYAHNLISCIVNASIELGAKQAGIEYISPPELQDIQIDLPSGKLRDDWHPFALNNKGKWLWITTQETDRATEQVTPRKLEGSSFGGKCPLYKEFYRGYYKSLFKAPNSLTLITTTNEEHMRSMMKYYGPATYMLYTVTPDYARLERFPAVDTSFYTRGWKRYGFPDFYLSTMSVETERDS